MKKLLIVAALVLTSVALAQTPEYGTLSFGQLNAAWHSPTQDLSSTSLHFLVANLKGPDGQNLGAMDDSSDLAQALNVLASQGWTVVGIGALPNGETVIVLTRPSG